MKDVTNVKVLESSRKVNFQGKEVKRGLVLVLEISVYWDLGKWSQYLHSVRVKPLGICPDLWT